MANNKKQVIFEELSKEELIEKCYNYKENIKILNEKIKQLNKKINVFEIEMSNRTQSNKIKLYMQETMSYIDEIERLKKKLKEV
jgi:tRNA A37 threonylcarbamoyladenosine dehydratase